MTATITAFDWVPSFARGFVRDLTVRWAFEELGERYQVRYLTQGESKQAAHRALQPYGQVPTLQDGDVTMFESGAILIHLALTRDKLLPAQPQARARALEWLMAALNTLEPAVADLSVVNIFEYDKPWSELRRAAVEGRVAMRLAETAQRLGQRTWYAGDFSIGDLVMVFVLRNLNTDPLLVAHPALAAYVARGVARPAFQRALAAQLAGFTGSAPPGFAGWVAGWEAHDRKRRGVTP